MKFYSNKRTKFLLRQQFDKKKKKRIGSGLMTQWENHIGNIMPIGANYYDGNKISGVH